MTLADPIPLPYKISVAPSQPCPEAAEAAAYLRALVAAIDADHAAFLHLENCLDCAVGGGCVSGNALVREARELRTAVMK